MPAVTLRPMRADECETYAAEQEAEYVESWSGILPSDAAVEKARRDRAEHLPDGMATENHRLLAAEAGDGEVVGMVWLGLSEPGSGSTEVAWLYDIKVVPSHRRAGYGRAILAEVERLAAEAGAAKLGLNVFGGNTAAIALYTAAGYEVTAQQMAKALVAVGEAEGAIVSVQEDDERS